MILNKDNFELAKKRQKVICQCDYCGKTFERMKINIERSKKVLEKDSCGSPACTQKRRKEVNFKLYGVENVFQSEKIKNKIAEQHIRKLGVVNPMQDKDIQNKQKATCFQNYGKENVFQSEEIKNKIKETVRSRYGVDNPFMNQEIRDKQKKTIERLYDVSHYSQTKEYKIKTFETTIRNHGRFPANNYGLTEKEIQEWLNGLGFKFKKNNSVLDGMELDLYDEDKKLALEYCGLYWHNELSPEPRNKFYHYNKYKKCNDKDIQLLTIFSDEWENRNLQCRSRITSILGIHDKKIFARKCSLKEISKKEGSQFFDNYHIQGSNKLGIIFFGLFYQDELVGVMSFGRHHRNSQENSVILDRLCFKRGFNVVGGSSKLFKNCCKWAKNEGYGNVLSWSDNRWSFGKIYDIMKFNLDKEMMPDYSYVDYKKAKIRVSKQSQRKNKSGCPEGMTELEWAKICGLARIWDCGKKRWVFKL